MSTRTNRDTQPTRRWMSYAEASSYVGVEQRQLRRWTPQGLVPCVTFPGSAKVYFDPAALKAFLESCTSTPSSPLPSRSR